MGAVQKVRRPVWDHEAIRGTFPVSHRLSLWAQLGLQLCGKW